MVKLTQNQINQIQLKKFFLLLVWIHLEIWSNYVMMFYLAKTKKTVLL